MRAWLLSGPIEHWRIGVPLRTWGVEADSQPKKGCYDKLTRGDVLYFYSTAGTSALVGVGLVTHWNDRTIPLWPNETSSNRSKYPHRVYYKPLLFVDSKPDYGVIKLTNIRITCAASINAVSTEADQMIRKRVRQQWRISLPATTKDALWTLRCGAVWEKILRPVVRWIDSKGSVGL